MTRPGLGRRLPGALALGVFVMVLLASAARPAGADAGVRPARAGAEREDGPAPQERGVVPAVQPDVRDSASARVEIVEFCDFRLRPCAELSLVLLSVARENPGHVRVVFRQLVREEDQGLMPLTYRAALAAGEQGRFWEMHDILFANLERQAPADILGMARQLELNLNAFAEALERQDWPMRVENQAEANRLGAAAMPAVYVNGKAVAARALDAFRPLIAK